MPLRQIVYVSALSPHQDPSCLSDILRESASNNAVRHVTGILLYTNGSLLQVLEGRTDTVKKLYQAISADPRHCRATKLMDAMVAERQFAEWSMGHAQLSEAELDQIAGLNDFFSSGHYLTELDPSIVQRILTEFRDGMWRIRIS